MKVFKKTRRPERFVAPLPNSKRETETTDLPIQTPKSPIWGWLELSFAVTLASAVLFSMLQVLVVAAEGIVE
jgi:hypothetical protein